ncbi:hypothetical protein Hanom_Chr04g00328171 [Helianthus anomalus]
MEKGKGGRLLLFATQTLCVFFLFHLIYIASFNFKATPSQQIKNTGRQILSEWKADHMRTALKKDDQHQSLQDLLARLVEGLSLCPSLFLSHTNDHLANNLKIIHATRSSFK